MAKTPRGCIPKSEAAALVGYTPGFIMTLARQGAFPEPIRVSVNDPSYAFVYFRAMFPG